jgi:hypothetical protein
MLVSGEDVALKALDVAEHVNQPVVVHITHVLNVSSLAIRALLKPACVHERLKSNK